jgi:hypothetical protein
MSTRKTQTPTLPILDAIDALANQIRKNFPEVPQTTIVLGSSGKSKKGLKLGHFAPATWRDEATTHEILISGEALARGAEAVLATLLHESAHAVAHMHQVRDTSNNGRYHNKRFKVIAEGLGLMFGPEPQPTIGWSAATCTPETLALYKGGISKLAASLTTYRIGANDADNAKPVAPIERNKTKTLVDCECESPVTVSKIWFASADMWCGNCQTPFAVVES